VCLAAFGKCSAEFQLCFARHYRGFYERREQFTELNKARILSILSSFETPSMSVFSSSRIPGVAFRGPSRNGFSVQGTAIPT
jgi:hypothetical protein